MYFPLTLLLHLQGRGDANLGIGKCRVSMPPDPLHHPARPGAVGVAAGQVGFQVAAVFQFQGGGLAACVAQGLFHFLRLGDQVGEIPAAPGQEERGRRALDIADGAGRFLVAARPQEAGAHGQA